jgi:hypothetical protein
MIAGFSEALIQGESNYLRFENFCLALFERVENRIFLPTSRTWDLGRDGRTTGPALGTHAGILCATLDDKIDEKTQRDLDRVSSTTTPDRLIYCCSR